MLLFFADLYGVAPELAREELDKLSALLGFRDLLDRRCNALSTGQKQRVQLARALIHRPPVMLLDEPTRGIDVGTKAEIYRLIGELAAQGKAIIFVSSYLPELLAICDRLAVMARGRLRDIRPVGDWTEESVMALAVGANEAR